MFLGQYWDQANVPALPQATLNIPEQNIIVCWMFALPVFIYLFYQ